MRPGARAVNPRTGKAAVFGYADKRPMPRGGYPDGETHDGVAIDRHPDAMLRDCPALWWVVGLWRSPVPRELPYDVVVRMTHKDREAWSVMLSSWYRATKPGSKT